MTRYLVREIKEEFKIDEAKLAEALSGYVPKYADPEGDPLGIIIDWFEQYGGSPYCDEIIGNVNFDVGYDIIERGNDE